MVEAEKLMILTVKVIARASRCEVLPQADGTYKVKLTRPALEGKANEQLREALSEHFHLPKAQVRILSGEHSSRKQIEILRTYRK